MNTETLVAPLEEYGEPVLDIGILLSAHTGTVHGHRVPWQSREQERRFRVPEGR
jgi:hypothetical protein